MKAAFFGLLLAGFFVGCANYTPVARGDDIPVFVLKADDVRRTPAEAELLVKDATGLMEDVAKLKKSREGLPPGGVKCEFQTREAVGYTAEGKRVEGIILVENIRWKGLYRPEIANKMRAIVVGRISKISKPIYVKEVLLKEKR